MGPSSVRTATAAASHSAAPAASFTHAPVGYSHAEAATLTCAGVTTYKALKVADLHSLESEVSVPYKHIAAEDMAIAEAGQYDVVTCMEMLEHVPDPASVIRACATLLAPGGRLFVSTINRTPLAFAAAIVGAEYVAGLLPKGTHDYGSFIRPSELAALLRAAGLRADDVSGLQYDPLRRTARVGGTTAINYLCAASRS